MVKGSSELRITWREMRSVVSQVDQNPLARIFPNLGRWTGISRIFSEVFMELSPLNTAITDKAEVRLTASQVSPGTMFV